mgnify:CR=1 FL=1
MQHIKDVGTVEGHRGAQGLVFGHVYGKAFFNLQHHPKIHFFATSIQRNHKNMTNILKTMTNIDFCKWEMFQIVS